MTYRLRVTARAVADADAAYAWIAEHISPARAERFSSLLPDDFPLRVAVRTPPLGEKEERGAANARPVPRR